MPDKNTTDFILWSLCGLVVAAMAVLSLVGCGPVIDREAYDEVRQAHCDELLELVTDTDTFTADEQAAIDFCRGE